MLESIIVFYAVVVVVLTACVMSGSVLNSLLAERQTPSSNPGRNGGRIFFSRVKFVS